MAKVLIVEDDEVIAQAMASHLARAGFDPINQPRRGRLARLRFEHPEVCVVDLMLPPMDGWRLIEQARAEGIGTPIIVVSARGTEHDRVHALEIGADDYLVKPFSMKELVARVSAVARRGTRAERPEEGEAIEVEELDRPSPSAGVRRRRERGADPHGVSACMRSHESEVGREQGRAPVETLGRREGHHDRTVDVFVRKLGEKIDRRAESHTFLQTRYGVGYTFEAVPKR